MPKGVEHWLLIASRMVIVEVKIPLTLTGVAHGQLDYGGECNPKVEQQSSQR